MRRALPLALPLLFACAHGPSFKHLEWPSPPETARIRFVTAFAAPADLDTSRSARLKRSVIGKSTALQLKQPMGLAVSPDGNRLYVADYMLNHVVLVDLEKKVMDVFAPADPMGRVFGVALDRHENVYVTEAKNHEVLVFDRTGRRIRQFGMNDLVRPTGIAVDVERELVYVADAAGQDSTRHRVLVFGATGEYLRELGPAEGEPGRGEAPGQFQFPSYVALDRAGNAYVADTLNFRVQVFDAAGRFLRAFGEMGEGPGTFNKVKGLAFDGFGNLYAVDAAHASVQMFNPRLELLMYFGGPAPFVEYMQLPSAIAVDQGRNRIYVAQTGSPRVNVYDLVNTTAEDALQAPAPVAPSAPPPAR
jgi:DNA-binding beta-propeller fold protein YncE